MIVGPLKKGLRGGLPTLIICFLLFSGLAFLSVNDYQSIDSRHVLYSLLQKNASSPVSILIINTICFGLGAFLISYFMFKHEISSKYNYIPAFLYLFFNALTLNKFVAHPTLFANIFVLLALESLLSTYREENVLDRIFNAALFFGIAVFFYINYSFFILLFFVSLIILRPFVWREWIVGIIGFITPIITFVFISYLIDFDYFIFFNDVLKLTTFFQKPLLSEYYYLVFAAIVILLLLVILKHLSNGLGGKVKTQKAISLTYWFFALSLVNFFSKNNNYYFPIVASIIPLSILIGDYLYNIKQLKIANTLLFLLLASGSLLFLMQLNII